MQETNEPMASAVEEFIERRITDCGVRENPALQETYDQLENAKDALEATLSTEQKRLFNALSDAYSLSDGETMQTYYRAGFSDAVLFMQGWANGDYQASDSVDDTESSD